VSEHALKLDHVGLRVTDLAASTAFYAAALAPLGMSRIGGSDQHAAFGIGHMPYLSIRLADTVVGPTHVAFVAASHAEVDAFHAAALAVGGSDEGAPGLRPDYHEHYYGAFVCDPDGHNIELVVHKPHTPES
jgi:catechol 2,3-dioxygenase-like lactoylglutathione lyase family enzyme